MFEKLLFGERAIPALRPAVRAASANANEIVLERDAGRRLLRVCVHVGEQQRADRKTGDEHDEHRQRRSRLSREVAERESRVGGQRVHPTRPACVTRFFLEVGDVAELAQRRVPGVLRGKAPCDEPRSRPFEMFGHLGLHFPLEPATQQEGPNPLAYAVEHQVTRRMAVSARKDVVLRVGRLTLHQVIGWSGAVWRRYH